MKAHKLDGDAIEVALASLDGWEIREGKLHRTFTFVDFAEAFGFMARCAVLAERMSHHPEWSNAYNRVVVDLTTHDCGGVSRLDVDMARKMNAFAGD